MPWINTNKTNWTDTGITKAYDLKWRRFFKGLVLSVPAAVMAQGAHAVVFNDTFDIDTGTTTSITRSLGGVSYTYTFTAQSDGGDFVWQSEYGDGNSNSINLASGSFDTATTERITIARDDAGDFTFTSIYIDNAGGTLVTVGGYSNGALVGSTQTMNTGGAGTLDFGGIGVDEVRISATDFFNTSIDSFVGDTDPPVDSDGSLIAAGGVIEPVGLDTTRNTGGEALDIFDFALIDGGGDDGQPLTVSQIVINVSGTSTDAERGQVTWRLNGPGASNVTGTYDSGADTITFSGLSISVADGGNETYTINAYYNDITGLTGGHTITLSVDGDTDLTVGASGTQMGSTTAVTNGTGTTIDVGGISLAFDGTDDTAVVADAAFPDLSGSWTIEAWVKPNTLAEHNGIFDITGGGNDGIDLLILSGGRIEVNTTYGANPITASGIISEDLWQHVALVADPTHATDKLRLYVDGVLVPFTSLDGFSGGTFSGDFHIGSRDPDYVGLKVWMDGLIDEVRVWDVARTESEIQTYRNIESATQATPASLIAYYAMNGAGQTLADGSTAGTADAQRGTTAGSDTADPVRSLESPIFATNLTQTIAYTEGDASVVLNDIVVSGPTSGTITASLTLSDAAAGTLTTDTYGSATSTFDAGTGVWMVAGSVSEVNSALADVAFTPATHGDQDFTIATQLTAAGNNPVGGTISLNVTGTNDAPTANANLTHTVTYTEDPGGSVALDDVVVTDIDTGDTITATFTLSDEAAGSLSTGTYGSATSTFNTGTGVWTVTGSISDVNAALAAVAFTPVTHWDQDITITTRIRDAAGTGPADGTISLDVTPANDAPTATNLTQTVTYTEDPGGSVALGDVVVTDVDTGDTITATFTSSNPAAGILTTGTFGSATSTYDAGTGVWTVTGSVSDVNAALAAVAFTPSANWSQNITLTTRIRDAADTGPANGTVTLDVTAVNDAPTDIGVSSNSILQSNTSAGADVGTLSSTDVDNSSFTYSLVTTGTAASGTCTADGDNSSFQINGTTLETASALAPGSYDVCVQTHDGATSFEKSLAVSVTDDVAPTVSSVSVPANATYVTGQNLDFTVNTDENVTVTTGGGTPRMALTVGATTRYADYISGSSTSALLFRYTVQAGDNDADGIAVGALDPNGGTLRDAAGNDLNLTLNSVSPTNGVLVDTAAPTATIVVADTALAVGETSVVTVTFSETVTGFANDDLTIANGTLSAVSSADGGTTWTATLTPTASVTDTTNVITLDNTGVTDAAGNAGTGTTDSNNYTIDTELPTATIAVADTELNFGETSLVTITFDAAVTGFTNADLAIENGTLSVVSSADSGITWTATFTPAADTDEPSNVITLDNTGVVDASGNAGTGTTDSNEFVIRTQAITLLVTSNVDSGDDATGAASQADDELDGDGLSIREALYWARTGDTITFDLNSGTAGNQGGTITLNGNPLLLNYANLAIGGDLDDDGIADVTISGNNASRVMAINDNLTGIEISGLTLTQGTVTGGGAGLHIGIGSSVTVRNSNITHNAETGLGGGGVYGANATLTMINSTVSGNSSTSFGGGLRIVGHGGMLNLISSTVSGNTTTGLGAHGGGVQFGGSGGLTIVNSTISGNTAAGDTSLGGGLRITNGTANVYNTTIVGNAAAGSGGGVYANGTETFTNTVVAGNTSGVGAVAGASGSPLATGGIADDVGGTVETATNSYFGTAATITTSNDSFNNMGTATLLLSDLSDNGGQVLTHRPQAGSALINAGSNAALPADTYDLDGDGDTAETLPVDANGDLRVSNIVDIGAVEGNAAPALSNVNGGGTFVENGTAIVIDSDILANDNELDLLNGGNGDYSGASAVFVRNGGAVASDGFAFDDGSGISLSGADLLKNGQIIATLDTSSAGQLTITFTSASGEIPTQTDMSAILQQVTYSSSSEDPGSSANIDITLQDGAGASATETASLTITEVNDAPTLSATGGTPTFTENGTAVDLFSGVTIGTVESGQTITGMALTVAGLANGASEVLSIDGSDISLTNGASGTTTGSGAVTYNVSVSGTTATITLAKAGGLSSADAETLIDGMSYHNNSEALTGSSRIVTLTNITDGGGTANGGADNATLAVAATVAVVAVNDPPTDIGLSATSLLQSATGAGAAAANLSTTDLDATSFAYSLVGASTAVSGSCAGDGGNASFQVDGAVLETVSVLAEGSYELCVQTHDGDTALKKGFTITVSDDVAPRVANVTVPTNGSYTAGQTLGFTINTSEAVSVSGTPRLAITIGSTTRYAGYAGGSATSALAFSYTVQTGDEDSDGVQMAAAIDLNGGSMADAAGNALTLTLNSVGSTASVLVDAVAPTLDSSTPVDGATNVPFDTNLRFSFSETVEAGTGTVALYAAADDSLVESVSANSSSVSISGSTATVTLADTLDPTQSYYVQIGGNAFADTAGNPYAGINDATTLNFTVANNAPVADDDTANVNEDQMLAIAVLSNDTDPDSSLNAASVQVTSGPANGSTSVNTGTGVITYTPTANFNGSDSFTYTVEDVHGGVSNTATVNITVNAVNDAPVAVSDIDSTPEDNAISIDVAANDTDIDTGDSVDPATLTIVSQPSNGTAVVAGGEVTFTPDQNFNGSDSFTYTIEDQNGGVSNVATVIVNVTGVNDLPTAVDDTAIVDEDGTVVIDSLANDSDLDGMLDATTVFIMTDVANGTTSVDALTGAVTYTPDADFNGTDAFTYVVSDDADGTSNEATVTITVNSINDAPVANADVATLQEDTPHEVNVLGNDSDVDGTLVPASVEVVTAPAQGSTSVNATTGAITYTPDSDFADNDAFTYRVQDNEGLWSSPAMVTMTVNAVNDAPLANNDSVTTAEDTAVTFSLLSNDSDVDGSLDSTSVLITADPAHGSVIANGDGTVTYTPETGYHGSDSFTYTVADDQGAVSNVATVSVTMNPVNDAPVIAGAPPTTITVGQLYSFTPTVSDNDGGDTLTFSATGVPSWLSLNSTSGVLSGIPADAHVGEYDGLEVTVSDGTEFATLAAFSITVVPGQDLDRDNVSDYQESLDGTDPNNAADYWDIEPPTLTAPAEQTLDAVALYTPVNVRQLLGLENGANNGEVQDTLAQMVSDNIQGDGCCNPNVTSMDGSVIFLPPGRNELTWNAEDRMGNTAEVTQVVNVRPLVSLSKDQTTVEDTTVVFSVILNGPAPVYPFEVPYVIDVASTADATDHNLVNGFVTFTETDGVKQTQGTVAVHIVEDGISENDEVLVVRVDDRTSDAEDLANFDPAAPDAYDINSGAKSEHRIHIVEGNLAPRVTLGLQQSNRDTMLTARDDGEVTATATVVDANPGDTHSISWTGTDNTLVDTDGDPANTRLVFNPAELSPGQYRVQVEVTDGDGAATVARLHFLVVQELPTLSADDDTDKDGIDDVTEGTADTDGDGIVDYLDNISAPNVLPEEAAETRAYLIECEPGVTCRRGRFALLSDGGGAHLTVENLDSQSGVGTDSGFTPVGGIFDFEIHGLPQQGQTTSVVIPQQAVIPENAVYRKFRDGQWSSFVENTRNALHSAPGVAGYCPSPGSDLWEPGLNAGDWCVQLTLDDGGPNDADGLANRAIEDPGAVSVQIPAPPPPDEEVVVFHEVRSTSGGGAVGFMWLLLGGALLAFTRRGRRVRGAGMGCLMLLVITGTLALPSQSTQAQEVGEFNVELGFSSARGSQSAEEFVDAMAGDEVVVQSQQYDTSRFATQMSVGYQFHPWVNLQLGYLDLGDVSVDFNSQAPNTAQLKTAMAEHYPATGKGWTLAYRYSHSVADRVNLTADLGLFHWRQDIDVFGEVIPSSQKSGTDPLLALGVNYRLDESLAAGIKIQRLFMADENIDLLGVSLGWTF